MNPTHVEPCDCHIHILGPLESYPLSPARGYSPDVDASPADYRAMAAGIGITRMVVVQPSVYGTDNRRTLDAVAALGAANCRAVAVIDAQTSDAELHRLDAAGVRGIRFNQVHGNGPAIDQLRVLARRVADHGWHIQFNAPIADIAVLAPVLCELPVPVVIDHMARASPRRGLGDADFQALLRLAARAGIWTKLCWYRSSLAGPPYDDMRDLVRALVEAAPEHCVWGSDWPYVNLGATPRPDAAVLLDRLDAWLPDSVQRRMILADNPARLYGFSDA